ETCAGVFFTPARRYDRRGQRRSEAPKTHRPGAENMSTPENNDPTVEELKRYLYAPDDEAEAAFKRLWQAETGFSYQEWASSRGTSDPIDHMAAFVAGARWARLLAKKRG